MTIFIKLFTLRRAFIFGSLLFVLTTQAAESNTSTYALQLITHGETYEPLPAADDKKTTKQLFIEENWYTFSIINNVAEIVPAKSLATSSWQIINSKTALSSSEFSSQLFDSSLKTIELPHSALFGFSIQRIRDSQDERDVLPIQAGKHSGILITPQLLKKSWSEKFILGQQKWEVMTRYATYKDGTIIPSSMELVGKTNNKETILLPAAYTTFSNQELLWIGDLNNDQQPDLVIKRTYLSGEFEYVLIISPVFNMIAVDMDRPIKAFSSGVDESAETIRHIESQPHLPPAKFGLAKLSIEEAIWNKKIRELSSNPNTKKTALFDKQLKIKDETIRFSFEYIPTTPASTDSAGNSSNENFRFWHGKVVVRVHFRGKSQVLMEASELDGSNFNLSVDMVDNQPAIYINYYPHYNNEFNYYWIMPSDKNRFMRWYTYHSQGC